MSEIRGITRTIRNAWYTDVEIRFDTELKLSGAAFASESTPDFLRRVVLPIFEPFGIHLLEYKPLPDNPEVD